MKLKHREIAEYRKLYLEQQDNCCALCGETIDGDAVLDHCHKTGKIRRVLHRGCNSMLGKIENSMPRSQMNIERLQEFAKKLTVYLTYDWDDIIHPTHKTPEERKMAYKKKKKQMPKPKKRKY